MNTAQHGIHALKVHVLQVNGLRAGVPQQLTEFVQPAQHADPKRIKPEGVTGTELTTWIQSAHRAQRVIQVPSMKQQRAPPQ